MLPAKICRDPAETHTRPAVSFALLPVKICADPCGKHTHARRRCRQRLIHDKTPASELRCRPWPRTCAIRAHDHIMIRQQARRSQLPDHGRRYRFALLPVKISRDPTEAYTRPALPASRSWPPGWVRLVFLCLTLIRSIFGRFGPLHPVRARFGRFRVWALTGLNTPGVLLYMPPGWGRAGGHETDKQNVLG